MALLLVILFIGVPLLEIFVIIQVGAAIGGWPTVGILVLDSLVGAWLLRVESRRAWAQFRAALAEGRWPGDEVAQGALVIVGGTLLLTPGFVTDVVGFLLLIGLSRRVIAGVVRRRFASASATGAASAADPRRRSTTGTGTSAGDLDIGVEVVEIEREQPRPDAAAAGDPDDPDASGRTGGRAE